MECRNSQFLDFIHTQGTIIQCSYAGTSYQNGRAEHKHCHILDSVKAFLLSASCPECFLGEAALTVVYTINRLPSSALQNVTPFERLYGTPASYSSLRIIGCACIVLLQSHKHSKLEPRSRLFMVFTSLLTPPLTFVLTLMLIGSGILLTVALLLAFVSF